MLQYSTSPSYLQALYNPPVLQVLFDNLIDIFPVYIGIPDRFRVHGNHRTLGTPVQTSGSINPHPALAGKTQRLATLLGVVTQSLCVKALAAFTAIGPQVRAEKDVVLVIGHI